MGRGDGLQREASGKILDWVSNLKNLLSPEGPLGRKKRPTSPANPFYGYPAELIAEWCGVSVGTAEHYKAGRRRPPTPVLRLFRLYRDGKVLDEDWNDYRVVKGALYGRDGKPVRPSDVVLIGLLWQALAAVDSDSYMELLQRKFG